MTKEQPIFSSVSYGGHRLLLPIRHYLRSIGQTKQCCADGYYDNNNKDVIIDSYFLPKLNKETIVPRTFHFTNRRDNDAQKERTCKENWVCCQLNFDKHYNFLRNNKRKYSEFNKKYDLCVLTKYLYYHNCDYREQVVYRRVSNELYLKDGIEASNKRYAKAAKLNNAKTNNKSDNDELFVTTAKLAVRKKKEDEEHVNGVKRPWIYSLLCYVNITRNTCFDPFHVLKNIIHYILCMLFGRLKLRPSTVVFCKNTESHPTLKKSREDAKSKPNKSNTSNADDKIPAKKIEVWRGIWELSSTMLKKLEIYLQNAQLPSGNTSSLRFKTSISQFGLVKGKELIEMFECSMDFICWSIQQISSRTTDVQKYPNEYLYFFSMFSNFISQLLAPIIPDKSIESLYNQAVEMISVYEGIFPVSETKMIHHQLIDLPNFIKEFGPLRGWWTFPSERSISQIKKEMGGNKGGKSFARRVYQREYSNEFMKQQNLYKDEESLYRDKHFFSFKNENTKVFTAYKTEVIWSDNPRTQPILIDFSEYETQEFLLFLINQMSIIQPDHVKRIQQSTLYRLYVSFNYHIDKKHNMRLNDFKRAKFDDSDFRLFLNNLYNTKATIDPQLVINSNNDKVDIQMFCECKGKRFMLKDLELIDYYLKTITTNISVSNKAFIWGTKFNARGCHYREYNKYTMINMRYGAQNEKIQKHSNFLNDLSKNFYLKRVYSSWFKSKKRNDDNEVNMGQLNCFFVLNIDEEPIVNKLSIAMVTMRETTEVSILPNNIKQQNIYQNLFKSTGNIRIDNNFIFELLHNIYPTDIVVAPMKKSILNNSYLPVLKTKKDIPKCYMLFQLNRNHCCILDNPDILSKLKHPYNLNIQSI
jgi:hypothetical protein